MSCLNRSLKPRANRQAKCFGQSGATPSRFLAILRVAVMVVLGAAPANAVEYPEFTGVYLRYGDRFIAIPAIETVTGYIAPSEPPANASRFNRFRRTTIAGTTVSPNNMLLLEGGLTIEGYIENVVLIPYHRENGETVSLVTVKRPEFRLLQRVNYVSRLDDLMRSMPQLTPRQRAQCADIKARGMAPLAGGFDECRAGDLKNEKNLRSFGWYLKANTGARYLVACPNQIPNRENFPMNEQVHGSLKARLTENCDAFGFEC